MSVFAVRRGQRYVAVFDQHDFVEAESSTRLPLVQRRYPCAVAGRGPSSVFRLLTMDVRTFASLRVLRENYPFEIIRRPEFDERDLSKLEGARVEFERRAIERGQSALLNFPPEKRVS